MRPSQESPAVLSLRNALMMVLSMVGLVILSVTLLAIINVPCVSNYYNQLPVYPDATLLEESRSRWIWLGFANSRVTYFTTNSYTTVADWFEVEVDEVRSEARRARLANDPVPRIWRGRYTLTSTADGVEIHLTSQCMG